MKKIKFGCVLKSKRISVLVISIVLALSFNFTKVYASAVVTRYDGINRYETAAKVCEDGWQQDTPYAVIVNGDNFPDAMSAAPLAKKYNAPILLTEANTLNPYTSSELSRLNVQNVFIIGGQAVVSQSIEDALKARGIKVTRLAGQDRYDTALQVAAKLGKPKEIAVVNADDFHDGMSIASIAAIKGMPIILTSKDYMPTSVQNYLKSNNKVNQVYVVGGTDEISNNIFSLIPNAKRIGNGDVYSRNVDVIDAFKSELNMSTIYIASAKNFPDSLAASALAPKTSSPVIFVDNSVAEPTQTLLKSIIVNNIKILGGAAAVSDYMEQSLQALPLSVASTSNITDTIIQGQKYTPRPTIVVTATDGNQKEVPVSWNLTGINTSQPGTYTFSGTVDGTTQIVYTTLIVTPIPITIADINDEAISKADFTVPSTVYAQMSDGTTSSLPVTWDYGTQQGNNPGVYVFYGTVANYTKKVKLTLTVKLPQIISIANTKLTITLKNWYTPPGTVLATMDDGTVQNVPVTWSLPQQYPNYQGVYVYTGTVSGYNKKVSLMLIVTGEGGIDPQDSNYPSSGGTSTTSTPDIITISDPMVQGSSYPATVFDSTTQKQVPVTWTKTLNIEPASSASYTTTGYVDQFYISTVTLLGNITGTNRQVQATINIIPKIIGIGVVTTDSNGNEFVNTTPPLNISVPGGSNYNMANAEQNLRAIILNPDGTKNTSKGLENITWNNPIISLTSPSNISVTGIIPYYNIPVTVHLIVKN